MLEYHVVATVHGGGASNVHTFLEFNWTDGKKYETTSQNWSQQVVTCK